MYIGEIRKGSVPGISVELLLPLCGAIPPLYKEFRYAGTHLARVAPAYPLPYRDHYPTSADC